MFSGLLNIMENFVEQMAAQSNEKWEPEISGKFVSVVQHLLDHIQIETKHYLLLVAEIIFDMMVSTAQSDSHLGHLLVSLFPKISAFISSSSSGSDHLNFIFFIFLILFAHIMIRY